MNTRKGGKSGRQNIEHLGMRREEDGVKKIGAAKVPEEVWKQLPKMCNGK